MKMFGATFLLLVVTSLMGNFETASAQGIPSGPTGPGGPVSVGKHLNYLKEID